MKVKNIRRGKVAPRNIAEASRFVVLTRDLAAQLRGLSCAANPMARFRRQHRQLMVMAAKLQPKRFRDFLGVAGTGKVWIAYDGGDDASRRVLNELLGMVLCEACQDEAFPKPYVRALCNTTLLDVSRPAQREALMDAWVFPDPGMVARWIHRGHPIKLGLKPSTVGPDKGDAEWIAQYEASFASWREAMTAAHGQGWEGMIDASLLPALVDPKLSVRSLTAVLRSGFWQFHEPAAESRLAQSEAAQTAHARKRNWHGVRTSGSDRKVLRPFSYSRGTGQAAGRRSKSGAIGDNSHT